jgi:hypothetical protein
MNFFPSRGCVYAVPDPSSGGAGFYSLEGLQTGQTSGTVSGVILLQGVDLRVGDIIQPVVTLENTKVLYTFGSDFGNVSIGGEILLGPANAEANSPSFNLITSYFDTNRVAISQKPVKLSMPGSKSYFVYLQGLSIGRVDPEFHIQPFAFAGIIAE